MPPVIIEGLFYFIFLWVGVSKCEVYDFFPILLPSCVEGAEKNYTSHMKTMKMPDYMNMQFF